MAIATPCHIPVTVLQQAWGTTGTIFGSVSVWVHPFFTVRTFNNSRRENKAFSP